MSDWIEKLRLAQPVWTRGGYMDTTALWPLLCDVVEAAEFSREREWAYPGELDDALAALKDEVER